MKRLVFVLALLAMVFGLVQPALAFDQTQRSEIERRPWHDNTVCYTGSGGTPVTNANSANSSLTGGKVYLLGDSIAAGALPQLTSGFTAKGLSPVEINALVGRNLQGTPPSPDGIAALSADVAKWKDAKAIVIELGTNTGGLTKANVEAAVKRIKQDNPAAKIFWVDAFRTDTDLAANNRILTDNATALGYTVIDWYGIVKDKAGEFLADNAHPNATGYPIFVKTIVDGVGLGGTQTTPTTSGAASCICKTGGVVDTGDPIDLRGNTNVEKSFNFFLSKGLTAAQSAGIVGNLMVESSPNVDPKADNGTHRGIAQWDKGGRYESLKKFAASKGVTDYDQLGIQLEFLWSEMPNQVSVRTRKDALTTVREATTPDAAAAGFEDAFERSGGAAVATRQKYAREVFSQFGSNTPTTGGGSSSTSSSNPCVKSTSTSNIDTNLPQGTADELIAKIKQTGKVGNAGLLTPSINKTMLAVALRLSEKYSFTLGSTLRPNDPAGSPHRAGLAIDLGNINGQGVPTGENYAGFNQIAADFIKDAATLIPAGGGAYIGVPNEQFLAIAEPIIKAKGGSALIETRANGMAAGAHFHLNVARSAP